jgi:hypothetical protein
MCYWQRKIHRPDTPCARAIGFMRTARTLHSHEESFLKTTHEQSVPNYGPHRPALQKMNPIILAHSLWRLSVDIQCTAERDTPPTNNQHVTDRLQDCWQVYVRWQRPPLSAVPPVTSATSDMEYCCQHISDHVYVRPNPLKPSVYCIHTKFGIQEEAIYVLT